MNDEDQIKHRPGWKQAGAGSRLLAVIQHGPDHLR